MDFDIRAPIGVLFLALGLVVGGYGLIGGPQIDQTPSLGLNINLVWGGVMAGFGAIMLALAALRGKG
jgi:hypothetical protein